jgi:hypothetical protein
MIIRNIWNMDCIIVRNATNGGEKEINMTAREMVRIIRGIHTLAKFCVSGYRLRCEAALLNEIVRRYERDRAETWRWVWIPPSMGL